MGANFLFLVFGSVNYKARLAGTFLNCLLALLRIIGGIMGLGGTSFCSLNVTMVSEYDGNGLWAKDGYTYSDEAFLIFLFTVIQSRF